MWPVLAHSGRSDLAYSIVKTTTYPGFGYWIGKGATTLLEQWDGRNSHNHQMFGSVDEFFYKYLAGRIESNWQQKAGSFRLNVVIPPNSSATVSIDMLNYTGVLVTESENKIWENNTFIPGTPGIIKGRVDGNFLVFSIGSGKYEFILSGKPGV